MTIIIIIVIIIIIIIIILIFLLPNYFSLGGKATESSIFQHFKAKFDQLFFFIEVTSLWKIKNNEEAVCKIPLCLLHKLFREKGAKE